VLAIAREVASAPVDPLVPVGFATFVNISEPPAPEAPADPERRFLPGSARHILQIVILLAAALEAGLSEGSALAFAIAPPTPPHTRKVKRCSSVLWRSLLLLGSSGVLEQR